MSPETSSPQLHLRCIRAETSPENSFFQVVMLKFPSQEKKTVAYPGLTLAGSWDAARQAHRFEI